jgi:hypothetical protein
MTTSDEMSGDFARQKLRQDAVKEWHRWLKRLSPAERKRLQEQGISGPPSDTHKVSGHSPHEEGDAADHPRASSGFDFTNLDSSVAAVVGQLVEEFHLPPDLALRLAQWHLAAVEAASTTVRANYIARIAGPLIREPNPKVSVAGLAFACNMAALNGLGTLRQYALINGLSPEAVSKKKRAWERELNLQPGPHSKSAAACEALSKAQQTKHWRKKKLL